MTERLETEYFVTREDIVRLMRRVYWRNRTRLGMAFANWLTVPTLFLVLAILSLAEHKHDGAIFYAFLGIVLLALLPLFVLGAPEWAFRASARMMEQAGQLGEIRLTLTAETFGVAGELGRSEWYWPKLLRAEETARGLVVFLTPANAVILPRTGFDPPEDYDAVKAFVLERFATTHPASEPPA